MTSLVALSVQLVLILVAAGLAWILPRLRGPWRRRVINAGLACCFISAVAGFFV